MEIEKAKTNIDINENISLVNYSESFDYINIKKIKLYKILKIYIFLTICIIIYVILIFGSTYLINYLGNKNNLQVNDARLIVSLFGILGTICFTLLANNNIQKMLKLLLIYDLQNTGIDILTLNKIGNGTSNILFLIKHIIKTKNYKWIFPNLLWIICCLNGLWFSRSITINAINKQEKIQTNVSQYITQEQINSIKEDLPNIDKGYTTYIMGDYSNIITWIDNSTISINNYLLQNFYEYEKIDNIILPSFTSNCVNPENNWKSDDIVNISDINVNDKIIMDYTNNEFLLTDIIALRVNGTYINKFNSSHIYGLTIKCYTILEYINATIYKNGTVISTNKNNIKDDNLWILSLYGI